MSDQLTQPPVPTPPTEPVVGIPDPAQETDWKAMSRKWEAQAKANAAAAKRLNELEESQKTEEQKRLEQVANLQAELTQYQLREQQTAWASEIVKDSTIPASVLRGSTREEMLEHFQSLQSLIPPSAQTQRVVIPREGTKTPVALNSSALEEALRAAVGAAN